MAINPIVLRDIQFTIPEQLCFDSDVWVCLYVLFNRAVNCWDFILFMVAEWMNEWIN